ncbi:MAG: ribonuclease J [Robiginitomaculum sp.]|nr:ribonuclease J [Robiginitomaculum sp.]MDQ7078494.1 ribonuclease J [Robiginitomaculum sp.]
MNLNLYGFGPEGREKWIIVDLGVTFGDTTTPGVEVIMPDPQFIAERADDLLGIILTHAHEDHMGALAAFWPDLRAPVYATPFTMYLVRDRLAEAGLLDEVPLHEIPLGGHISLGPFEMDMVTLTHSIPEPNALLIRTPAGLILHTGDWKIDPDPLIGEATDAKALIKAGEEGILAMVCDSTNVFTEGEAGSEAGVRDELIKLVGEQEGRVAVAAFASNVARLQTAVEAAEYNGRTVCLVGRSMHRMMGAARHVGLFANAKPFIDEEEAAALPRNKVLYLCTGSQGEPRAALSRIASGSHRHVKLSPGDSVLFSSRVIPGNEKSIFALQNALASAGVNVIGEKERHIHVSGHPCRDELRQMYAWARPKIAIPVHGERRHLIEHAKLARELQVAHGFAPRNGDMIKLSEEGAELVDEVPAGRIHRDGDILTPAEGGALRERKKLAFAGAISVALAVDSAGRIHSGPEANLFGLAEPAEGFDAVIEQLCETAQNAVQSISKQDRGDELATENAVRQAVRRLAPRIWGKRPHVDVIVLPL